jgi:hypothetical protein
MILNDLSLLDFTVDKIQLPFHIHSILQEARMRTKCKLSILSIMIANDFHMDSLLLTMRNRMVAEGSATKIF